MLASYLLLKPAPEHFKDFTTMKFEGTRNFVGDFFSSFSAEAEVFLGSQEAVKFF
jgi:hypothetical protein